MVAHLKSEIVRYFNGRVLSEPGPTPGELWTCQGRVIAPQQQADRHVDVNDLIIAPGYIDLQINGAFGVDFSQQPQRVLDVARQLPQYGVTSFLPTLVSLE
jgi:N-acetylglucosamine-6-phosphate deacetylase